MRNTLKKISVLISFFFLILISCQPQKRLSDVTEIQKWEPDIARFDDLPVSSDPNTIIFTGSSSIRLWKNIQYDLLPYKVIARGYGGANLSDFSYYCRRITDAHKCGAIVIFVANDITGNKSDKTPGEVFKLMKKSVKLIRMSHKETPLFWIEITPTPSRWNSWDKIAETNNLIRNYSKNRRNLYFISTSNRFLGPDGKPDSSLFQPDMLHLNDTGYKIWSECILQSLDAVVPELKANY